VVLQPDVVLMDLHMPVLNGVEATTILGRDAPASRVVVPTTYADDEWVFPALRAGAKGFLTKDADAEEIRRAVLTAAGGLPLAVAALAGVVLLTDTPVRGNDTALAVIGALAGIAQGILAGLFMDVLRQADGTVASLAGAGTESRSTTPQRRAAGA
jgi:CheY-like chemotaxis protein